MKDKKKELRKELDDKLIQEEEEDYSWIY